METPKGIFEAEYLVNAAGAWAGEVARRAGLTVPVQPVRRIVYATVPTAWRHTYPLTIDLASGFYLRSKGNRVLFGRSNSDEPPGFTEGDELGLVGANDKSRLDTLSLAGSTGSRSSGLLVGIL